ncbi:MAG: hydrogenase maturation protease [Terriglobales bacterium]
MEFRPERALIIGYGNPLRSDDGFGWHVAQQLASSLRSDDVEVLARQQLTPELAETASHYPLIIFIDAARDLAPGELRCTKVSGSEAGDRMETPGFSHFLTPTSLLALTAELYDRTPESYCIAVGGESFAEGDSMSSTMQAAFAPVMAQVLCLLDQTRRS